MIKDDDESDHIHYIKLTSVHCFDSDATASWGHRENQMTANRKICDLSLVTVYLGLSYTVTQRSMLKYDHRPTLNFSKFYSNFFHLFFKNRIIQNFVCFKRLNTKAVSYKIAKFILKNNFTRPIRIALQGTTYSGFLYVIVVTTIDFSTFFLKFSC